MSEFRKGLKIHCRNDKSLFESGAWTFWQYVWQNIRGQNNANALRAMCCDFRTVVGTDVAVCQRQLTCLANLANRLGADAMFAPGRACLRQQKIASKASPTRKSRVFSHIRWESEKIREIGKRFPKVGKIEANKD